MLKRHFRHRSEVSSVHHVTSLIPSTAKEIITEEKKKNKKAIKSYTALGRASGKKGRQARADRVIGMRHQLLKSVELKRNSEI